MTRRRYGNYAQYERNRIWFTCLDLITWWSHSTWSLAGSPSSASGDQSDNIVKKHTNTLKHFEVEAVERFLKELGILNPFLGSAKVKNAYFKWHPNVFQMADKML